MSEQGNTPDIDHNGEPKWMPEDFRRQHMLGCPLGNSVWIGALRGDNSTCSICFGTWPLHEDGCFAGELETSVRGLWADRDRLAARVVELQAAIRHVVRNSPGTPDSVKGFLVRALEGAWGEPYERAILSTLDSPEWAESPDRSEE